MSDVWQGPGWWLASDGKWYPADEGPGGVADASGSTLVDADDSAADASADVARAAASSGTAAAPATRPAEPVEPAATGGWQAVEPDEALAVDDQMSDVPPPATDDWSEAPLQSPVSELEVDDEGWTSGYDEARPHDEAPIVDLDSITPETIEEIPDVEQPTAVAADLTSVTIEDLEAATDPGANGATAGQSVIERDEAWRKPADRVMPIPDARTVPGTPEVVDLGVPADDSMPQPGVGVEEHRWRPVLQALGLVAALILLVLLVRFFFFGDDSTDSVATDDNATTTTATDAPATSETTAAPSTDAPDTSAVDTTTDPTEGIEVSVFELRAGDCIKGSIGTGQVQRLKRVDCSIPHEFEVYREAEIDASITEFDAAAIEAQAEEICRSSLAQYIPESDDRNIKFKWFQPTAESWNQETNPDRVITCLLFDEDGLLIGRAA